jgi:hypothetical protein
MDRAQKFKVVAAIKGIARRPCMEVDKPYPIKRAFKKLQMSDIIIFLMLSFDDGK